MCHSWLEILLLYAAMQVAEQHTFKGARLSVSRHQEK